MIFKVSSFTTGEADELRSKILNVLTQMQFCVKKMEKVTTPLGKSIIKDLIFWGKNTHLEFSIAYLKWSKNTRLWSKKWDFSDQKLNLRVTNRVFFRIMDTAIFESKNTFFRKNHTFTNTASTFIFVKSWFFQTPDFKGACQNFQSIFELLWALWS